MVPCKKFRGVRLPYFMQTPERKRWEVEAARRALGLAMYKTNYCVNMCSYACFDLTILSLGGNPRGVIRSLKGQVADSLRNPDYAPKHGPYNGSAHLRVQMHRAAGHPLYCSKEVRRQNFESHLEEI